MTDTITVGVVDDQPLLVGAFSALIDAQPDMTVVGTGATGREAVELVRTRRPDVLVMDIRMPDMDGVEATRIISGETDATKVLVLTTFNVDRLVLGSVAAGARGFLLKDADPDEVLAGIRSINAGGAVIASQAAPALLDAFRPPDAATAPHPGVPVGVTPYLSDREREVLTLVGRGLTNAEIADELVIAVSTVKTHVGNLMAKLDARDRVALVILAYSVGLVGAPGTIDAAD